MKREPEYYERKEPNLRVAKKNRKKKRSDGGQ